MRWIVRLLAAAVVLAAGMGQAQQVAPRYALVIGNAAYQTPGWQLVNPVNDANLMATRLMGLGFQVTPLLNATKVQMEAAMNAFTARVSAGGVDAVGVFYYAGHGVEHDGANLLVPVDVTARSMDELRYQAPPMQFLLRDMARAGNKVNIIILDACRNLPLPAGSRAGPAGGLAELADVPDNVLIAYATRPGLTAPDNPDETNSVFTRTLSDALARNPSDTAVNLFAGVQARVFAATGSLQRPEFRSGLLRAPDWRFASARAPVAPAVDPELERLRRENEALRRVPQASSTGGGVASPATMMRPPIEGVVRPGGPGNVFRDCADCPEMVVIPAGSFGMGPDPNDPLFRDTHPVSLRSFAAGRYEVTRGEWAAFVNATARAEPVGNVGTGTYCTWRNPGYAQDDRHPVTCVSWHEAQAYVLWIAQRTGQPYRLLTEAEWEYASRAGTNGAYWFGSSMSPRNANYADSGKSGTVRVGSYAPNAFGLYDTIGNVREWVEDCQQTAYSGIPADGSANIDSLGCEDRRTRGGAWQDLDLFVQSRGGRGSGLPSRRNNLTGFRIARAL